jgi:hypothetical protein
MASELPISSAGTVIAARVNQAIEAAKQSSKFGHFVVEMRFTDGEVAEVKFDDQTRLKFSPRRP